MSADKLPRGWHRKGKGRNSGDYWAQTMSYYSRSDRDKVQRARARALGCADMFDEINRPKALAHYALQA
jgi:hypothetical protein